jgi:hypothetical protein
MASLRRLPLLALALMWGGGPAAAAGDPGTLDAFEARRQAVLEAYAGEGREKFIRAQCLFALGRDREALAEVNKGLDALEPGNRINRWMHGGNTGFIAWPGIECYLRFERLIDAATRERYRGSTPAACSMPSSPPATTRSWRPPPAISPPRSGARRPSAPIHISWKRIPTSSR